MRRPLICIGYTEKGALQQKERELRNRVLCLSLHTPSSSFVTTSIVTPTPTHRYRSMHSKHLSKHCLCDGKVLHHL